MRRCEFQQHTNGQQQNQPALPLIMITCASNAASSNASPAVASSARSSARLGASAISRSNARRSASGSTATPVCVVAARTRVRAVGAEGADGAVRGKAEDRESERGAGVAPTMPKGPHQDKAQAPRRCRPCQWQQQQQQQKIVERKVLHSLLLGSGQLRKFTERQVRAHTTQERALSTPQCFAIIVVVVVVVRQGCTKKEGRRAAWKKRPGTNTGWCIYV